MKKLTAENKINIRGFVSAAAVSCVLCTTVFCGGYRVYAEEGYSLEEGYYSGEEPGSVYDGEEIYEEDIYKEEIYNAEIPEESAEESAQLLTGTYSGASGWSVDTATSTGDATVYKSDVYSDTETTSTISCSYIDTSYSVIEYEQLRDMLSNSLLYENVNAQISTSAVYTDAKDYLYILLVDDSEQSYRDIYYYVVGDYRCFRVSVREYRAEAEELQNQGMSTPKDAGQSIAQTFTWNK